MERLADSDLILFKNAQGALANAQAIFEFSKNHLVTTYKLGPEDQVNMTTGEITRPTTVEETTPTADNG